MAFTMPIKTAVQIIKQTIDGAVKAGLCHNIEATETISTAWRVLLFEIEKIQSKIDPVNDEPNP